MSSEEAPKSASELQNVVTQFEALQVEKSDSSFGKTVEGLRKRNSNPQRKGVPRRDAATSEIVAEVVRKRGGDRAITSILVANNGLGAVKFMRSVRSWAFDTFQDDKAITLVAMATPEDIRINAEHVQAADQFVEVPGGTNNNNYANISLILQTAERAQVDAVWPGWGHASENPDLPKSLSAAGFRFLGPPSAPMAALGDKVGSTILAQAAGVPTLPWSGSHVVMSFEECEGVIPPEIYAEACVSTVEEALTACERIGYPVMLKASWGGGGKGIRLAISDEEVRTVFRQVQGEVPGSPVFAMMLSSMCRHLEVQLVCDMYGGVASLSSRDCSVQRRHQKIVEEGPIVGVDPEMLLEMEKSARSLARSVGYVGAATVEFLYSIVDKKYYFLELNPRLQVEHPVTEGIMGLNLPSIQVMIGMGIPLHRIPDIRRLYSKSNLNGSDKIDFEEDPQIPPDGHVVAVRITSENATDGFKPTSGKIDEIIFRPTSKVWGYFSVTSEGGIHEFSDSQFGHLFAKGATRNEAISAMVTALKELKIRGEIRTTVEYVTEMIQDADFLSQQIHTAWLDRRIAMQVPSGRPPINVALISYAIVKAMETSSSCSADYLELLAKGQIPPSSMSLTSFEDDAVLDGMKYHLKTLKQSQHDYLVILNGSSAECRARTRADGGILLQIDGQKHVVHWENEPLGTRLQIDSCTCLFANEHDPSQVLSPCPGKIIRYLVEDGTHLEPDQPYAEVEVMKILMPLLAPAAGRVLFQVPEGAVLKAGDVIAKLDLDDPGSVTRAVPSDYKFPNLGPPTVHSNQVDHMFERALNAAYDLLSGYERTAETTIDNLLLCLDDPLLPVLQWQDRFSVAESRLPKQLQMEIEDIMGTFDAQAAHDAEWDGLEQVDEFPAQLLLEAMKNALKTCADEDKTSLQVALDPLINLVTVRQGGQEGFANHIAMDLLERYLRIEELFQTKSGLTTEQDIIYSLRQENSGQLQAVLDMVLSHHAVARKSLFVKEILMALVLPSPQDYRPLLRRLTNLTSEATRDLNSEARQLLEQSLLADLRAVVARALSGLDMFSNIPRGSEKKKVGTPSSAVSSVSAQSFSAVYEQVNSTAKVSRKDTNHEGLFKGLGNVAVSSTTRAQVDAQKMMMLVEAPAAVDDALALVLCSSDMEPAGRRMPGYNMQNRAMVTYIRRLYYPHVLRDPIIISEGNMTISVWSFEDPLWSGTSGGEECQGAMVVADSLSQFVDGVETSQKAFRTLRNAGKDPSTYHFVLSGNEAKSLELSPAALACLQDVSTASPDTATTQDKINATVQGASPVLRRVGFKNVSVLIKGQELQAPDRHGYHWDESQREFARNPLLNYVEPPVAETLELSKLIHLNPSYSPSRNRQWHLFTVTEQEGRKSQKRVYLRGMVRQVGGTPAYLGAAYDQNEVAAASAIIGEVEDVLGGCIEELARVRQVPSNVDWAHIYLAVLPCVNLNVPRASSVNSDGKVAAALKSACAAVVTRHGNDLREARVAQWEVKLRVPDDTGAWRVVVSLPTGHEMSEEDVDVYREVVADGPDGRMRVYKAVPDDDNAGELNVQPVMKPYGSLDLLQQKRLEASRHQTTYCYDFPKVFGNALREIWAARAADGEPGAVPPAGELVEVQEMGLVEDSSTPEEYSLKFVSTSVGMNKIGMLAWLMTLKTPECSYGRQSVVIANDITFQSGSFGPKEDKMFQLATEYALEEKLPVVYLAANSGARVGLATEIRDKLKVEWTKEDDPSKGFQYIYLDDADYQLLVAQANLSQKTTLVADEIPGPDGKRWRLSDVIGLEDGLGVENLSGSGAIAGAFSKAFREGFTITLVSGRTVGIGAYLARLGRRCIQRVNQPIILTGFQALNKLLGRDVYTSHMQLGGPRVMSVNGISHHTVNDDLEGIRCIIRWLSYTPAVLGAVPLLLPTSDPVNRSIGYSPTESEKLDPRKAIMGCESDDGDKYWISGLFDRGSWTEAHPTWACTVVTGRARLGGVPIGVIAVETQTVMKNIPADPGMLTTAEQVITQAGQVWFPDSATKTALAMEEFNLEGLPLMILANWRGFSGGQRDLFEGILQCGSLIVENLRSYKQPAFVYLPPGSELRGGAWVVVDSKLNPDMVELYADPSARGGVLEPEGIVEIKFRKPDLIKAIHRLDPVIQKLKAEDDKDGVKDRIAKLLPVYHQVAVQFAEMHDKPSRMGEKGTIRGIVPWKHARGFFVQRLRRRLAEEALVRHIESADQTIERPVSLNMLRDWFLCSLLEDVGDVSSGMRAKGIKLYRQWNGLNPAESKLWQDDETVLKWVESTSGRSRITTELKNLRASAATRLVEKIVSTSEGTSGLLRGLKDAIQSDSTLRSRLEALIHE